MRITSASIASEYYMEIVDDWANVEINATAAMLEAAAQDKDGNSVTGWIIDEHKPALETCVIMGELQEDNGEYGAPRLS